jgi:hypothetical protein
MIAFLTKMIFDPKPQPQPADSSEQRRVDDNSYTYEDEYGNIRWSTSDEDEE